jgi:sensor domain CHASE-containing protein
VVCIKEFWLLENLLALSLNLGRQLVLRKTSATRLDSLVPALALVSVGVDILQIQQEQQREKQMADVRRDITSQFQVIAKDLENQIEIQLVAI